jgi:predicted anti-sigma-YlaC factor YlaD
MADTTPGQPPAEEEVYFGPCRQMRTLLSQMADGTLRGLLRRFAEAHLSRCAHCQSALRGLHRLRERMHRPGAATPAAETAPSLALTPERRAAVEAAWARIEEEPDPPARS